MTQKKVVATLLKYILSIILVIFYSIVLFGAKNPDVSKEYKMHYIEKNLVDWPGYGGLDYSLGKKIAFGFEDKENLAKCKGSGWYAVEPQACWTGPKAKLYFNVTDKINRDAKLKLILRGAMPNVSVDITVNENKISSFYPSQDRKEYEFVVPKEIMKNGFLSLNFDVRNCKRPSDLGGSKDDRLLGIFVESISLA